MGLQLKDLVKPREIRFEDLNNRTVVFDTFNVLYQFLTTIRQPDGTPLKDSKGNVTSHISGLFNRISYLLQKNIRPAFVFDGEPPKLKKQERQRRADIKAQAKKEYEVARQQGDIGGMKKYASRTTVLTPNMVDEAKELIEAFGIPIIIAPSEGEAQAAFMVGRGDAYAVVSQDYDALMFGAPLLVRNLSVSRRKKRPGSPAYDTIKPEIISLSDTLNSLGITHDQLIILGILVGTDFNKGGIKGIGPKNALKLVKEHREDYVKIFEEVKWEEHYDFSWKEVYEIFKSLPTTQDYSLRWASPDISRISGIMERYEFSEERVRSQLEKLEKSQGSRAQKGLGDFF